RLLAIFLQVVQAMAFAHSRGVVHRDLTPSNVMVGEHGEVQVMDWGLARVLGRGGRAGGDGPEPRALASEPPMGTPGYMAPEQMTGAMARADERTDVFGLGSILCELLTGSPAYDGQAARAGKDRATPIDLAGAHTRLMACGADGELIALARTCLAVDPACRPRDAGEVETRLTAYLDGVRERLRRAELERVEAQARAAEERTRRRLAVALTAALLTLVTLGGVGGALYARHRLAQWSRTASILREVDRLRAAAAADPAGAVAPWSAAQEAVRLARTQLDPTPASIRARLEGLAGQVERGLAAAEADRRLLRELELPRARSGERELGEADAAYAAAFGADGLDVDRRDPAELGRILARRPAAVTQAVVAALDDWSIVRRNRPDIEAVAPGRWRRPQEAARAADPDPWRNALRDALGRNDRAAYARLAEADGLERRPAPSLWLLGRALIEAGEPGRAAAVLQRAWRAYPTDFWINLDLSHALAWSRPPRFEDGDRFATAAVALRPESSAAHVGLALSLHRRGDRSGAEAEYREALRLRPDYAMGHYNLGNLLADMERLDEAIAAYRAAMRGNHNVSANAHVNLGSALIRLGRLDEAAAELREVTRSRPNLALAWSNLSLVLKQLGDTEGAARADRRAADLGLPARDPGASTPGPSR
ncbi:MAG TPA: protein kinase family protein, partial [Isosphaeraceae bacterium]